MQRKSSLLRGRFEHAPSAAASRPWSYLVSGGLMVNRIMLGINFVLVAAILLLSFAVLSNRGELQSVTERVGRLEGAAGPDAAALLVSVPVDEQARKPATGLDPDAVAKIRQLIRDELRSGSVATPAGSTTTRLDDEPLVDLAVQSALVDQELEFYMSRGAISPAEMIALQNEIAKLGPQGRVDAMRRLVGAINAGELNGQL